MVSKFVLAVGFLAIVDLVIGLPEPPKLGNCIWMSGNGERICSLQPNGEYTHDVKLHIIERQKHCQWSANKVDAEAKHFLCSRLDGGHPVDCTGTKCKTEVCQYSTVQF